MLESQVPRLVPLLLAADRYGEAVALLNDPDWLALRVGRYGFDAFLEDVRPILLEAVMRGRDDDVVRVLLRAERAGSTYRTIWEDGSAAGAIAAADSPKAVRGVLRALGSSGAPWPSLLGMVKLLDLRAVSEAADLLRQIAEEGWPGYRPRAVADGLARWSDAGIDAIVCVLVRALEASPTHVSRVARRLYERQRPTVVPNSFSVWAKLLEDLISSQAPARRIMAAVEQVRLTVLANSSSLAVVVDRLCEARHRAIEAVASDADAEWLATELGFTMILFAQFQPDAAASPEDEQFHRTRRQAQRASLLLHLAALESRVRDPALQTSLAEAVAGARHVASVPERPTTHDYGDRSFTLARYALALDAVGHPQATEAADVALCACELDARSNDPPLLSVRKALDTLEAVGQEPVKERARAMRQTLASVLAAAPADAPSSWSPSIESSDPLEYGLALLTSDGSCIPHVPFVAAGKSGPERLSGVAPGLPEPLSGVPPRRSPNLAEPRDPFGDQVLRALSTAWACVGDPGAVEHVLALDALRPADSAFVVSPTGIARNVARRIRDEAAAIAHLRTWARRTIAEGDINEAASVIADLAARDPEEALQLFDECGLQHPSDRGGLITMILLAVLGSDRIESTAIARALERLPQRSGRPAQFELSLLAADTTHPLVAPLADRIVARCVEQLESDVDVMLPDEDEDAHRPTIAEVEKRVMRVAAPVAACATARSLGGVHDRFVRILERVGAHADHPSIQYTARRVLLRTLTDSWRAVRHPEAADFYVRVLGAPVKSDLFPKAFEGADQALKIAWSIFDIAPERAHELAEAAFAFAADRLVDASDLDHLGRSANLLLETFAGMRGGRPSDVVDAIRFVDAAAQWALKGGFADVAVVLETLAARAVSERIRTVLAGGSAKLWLRAGDVARAEPWLRTAAFDLVAELDMVAAIPAGEDTASSRRTVANRLANLLRDLRLDAEWLGKLMTLGIEQMTMDEAIAHLEMIESAWKQETAVVSV